MQKTSNATFFRIHDINTTLVDAQNPYKVYLLDHNILTTATIDAVTPSPASLGLEQRLGSRAGGVVVLADNKVCP